MAVAANTGADVVADTAADVVVDAVADVAADAAVVAEVGVWLAELLVGKLRSIGLVEGLVPNELGDVVHVAAADEARVLRLNLHQ